MLFGISISDFALSDFGFTKVFSDFYDLWTFEPVPVSFDTSAAQDQFPVPYVFLRYSVF